VKYRVFDPEAMKNSPENASLFLSDLKSISEFDAALICTPNSLHVEHALLCARAGLHLFIEKPLTTDLAGLEELKRCVDAGKVLHMVSCNFRFEAGMLRIKDFLKSGALGQAYSVLAEFGQYLPTWRPHLDYRQTYSAQSDLGGGIILDRIHELDYLMYLFGAPERVISHHGHLSHLEMDVEDTADIFLEFKGPVHCNLHLDYLQAGYNCRFKVTGEKGTLTWQFKPSKVVFYDHTKPGSAEVLYENEQPDVNQMYRAQLEYFISCLRDGKQPMNSIHEAERTVKVCLEAKTQVQSQGKL
jgi:predicted dehydrogenase